MSRFALERLDASHDRKRFRWGLESIDRYLKETAPGHTEKGIASRRLTLARMISSDSIPAVGGIGIIVDPASEALVSFYDNHGFVRISEKSLRLLLSSHSLV